MGKGVAALASALALTLTMSASAMAQLPSTTDPRVGLAPGLENPGVAKSGMELLAHRNKPAGFFNPTSPGSFSFVNSDLAFQGDHAFIGGFHGIQIWNIANPSAPTLRTAVVCPGGQGDVSVFGNLMFMSVEEARGRIDCGTGGATSATRLLGVRIFDISNLDAPVQVAAVQTCRGSHTHTVVTDEDDPDNVYVYVQGTAGTPRPASELAGCSNASPSTPGANPSRWRIEVIKVPLAAPETAAIVNQPRLFQEGDRIDGLQQAVPTPQHPSGTNWSPTPITDACHDITVYPEIELAAGACEGNGILIDISDAANPQRIDAVADPNFAYWHGATFSNDGKTVVFTDEWGGGTSPRCRATDQLNWGANAIYEIVEGKLQFRSYFKIPPAQITQENCVSHLPSLVPVPGRDIMVQAWYQGGASLIDFTDPRNPKEIGYWDRGPINDTGPGILGGFWSTYWYNGATFGSEIARGFDSFALTPTDQMSSNEIAAAREVLVNRFNPQHQDQITWQPSFAVTRSFRDQLERAGAIDAKTLAQVDKFVDRAERFRSGPQANAARAQLRALANQLDGEQYDSLRESLIALADA
jgi:hypothetical protein